MEKTGLLPLNFLNAMAAETAVPALIREQQLASLIFKLWHRTTAGRKMKGKHIIGDGRKSVM